VIQEVHALTATQFSRADDAVKLALALNMPLLPLLTLLLLPLVVVILLLCNPFREAALKRVLGNHHGKLALVWQQRKGHVVGACLHKARCMNTRALRL
jgi:hypothetical protein